MLPSLALALGHLQIEDAVKIYETRGVETMAVDHCSIDIAPGEICMIVGPSGCGKTTLLNAVAGFHDLTSGTIRLDGKAPGHIRAAECSAGTGPRCRIPERRVVSLEDGSPEHRFRTVCTEKHEST